MLGPRICLLVLQLYLLRIVLTYGTLCGWWLIIGLAECSQCRGADPEEYDEDAEEHGKAAALCEALQGLHFFNLP